MSIPKPKFHDCDETSLRLKWDQFSAPSSALVFLQYKEIFEAWDQAKQVEIIAGDRTEISLTEADVVDLKPGTPYCVRLLVIDDSDRQYGPETVFDTKPIDCTPKQKKCIIS
jgi:hypothetical protein